VGEASRSKKFPQGGGEGGIWKRVSCDAKVKDKKRKLTGKGVIGEKNCVHSFPGRNIGLQEANRGSKEDFVDFWVGLREHKGAKRVK